MRLFIAICVALVTGSFGAWASISAHPDLATRPIVLVVCALFWGVPLGLLFLVSGRNSNRNRLRGSDSDHQDPWIDENGVHRYFGDVFDRVNHPTPGAADRFDI